MPRHQIPQLHPTHAEICEPEVIAVGTNSKYLPLRFKGVSKRRKTLFTFICLHSFTITHSGWYAH